MQWPQPLQSHPPAPPQGCGSAPQPAHRYLELIALYKKLLAEQRSKLEAQQERLEIGLIKLRSSAGQVAEMQAQLKDEQVVVDNKKAETDALLVQVGQESSVADEQSELAAIEEGKVMLTLNLG